MLSKASIPEAANIIRRDLVEEFAFLIIPVLFGILLIRGLLLPVKWFLKIGIHCACGICCLWLLNGIAPFTGIQFPINAVTALTAGLGGIPGIGLLALMAVLG